jgi:hypothetical protein
MAAEPKSPLWRCWRINFDADEDPGRKRAFNNLEHLIAILEGAGGQL